MSEGAAGMAEAVVVDRAISRIRYWIHVAKEFHSVVIGIALANAIVEGLGRHNNENHLPQRLCDLNLVLLIVFIFTRTDSFLTIGFTLIERMNNID
jgi:hypothetical protein